MHRIALVAMLLGGATTSVAAQDLAYTVTTRGKFSSAVAVASGMMGPAQAVSGRAYLKGTRARLEIGPNPFLLDAARQEMTLLNVANKTYATMSLKDLPTRGDSLFAAAGTGALVSTSTGRSSETVNGLATRRTTVQVRIPARNPAAPRATDQILVSEIWSANQDGMGTAYERVADVLGRSGLGGSMLMMLAAQNPRMGAAMQLAAKALAGVRGLPVRRTYIFGNIKAGARFAPGTPLDTIMSTRTDLTDVKAATLPASLFQVPAGYARQGR